MIYNTGERKEIHKFLITDGFILIIQVTFSTHTIHNKLISID